MDKYKAVTDAIARHPGEFGLRGWPGKRFRVGAWSSYWSDAINGPALYTQRYDEQRDRWLDFAKGSEAELISNKIAI